MADEFVKNGHFIIFFIILAIILSVFVKEYALYILALVLIGQILLNTGYFRDIIGGLK